MQILLDKYDIKGIVAVGVHPITDKLLVVTEPDSKPTLYKSQGQISVPMGTIEPGETPEQTLVHEMMDETGNTFTDHVVIGELSFKTRCQRSVGLVVYAVRLTPDCHPRNFSQFMDRNYFLSLPKNQIRLMAPDSYYLYRIAEKLTGNDIFGKKHLIKNLAQRRTVLQNGHR